jgi:2-methylisocitrate lyase-like PEP mutase family enzyme
MPSQADKATRFRKLHEDPGTFVIPNPWDAGSARVLAALGFNALATTSSGFAFSVGRPDGAKAVSGEQVLANARDIAAATALPVNGDLENCYADDAQVAAGTIALAAQAGLVGCSIEDFTGDRANPIYGFAHAVERVLAAVEAARALPFDFVLTARAENLIRGVDDLADTIKRLQAFQDAGADVLYAPGLNDIATIRSVLAEVDRPLNVLVSSGNAHLTLAQLTEAGVKRISVGGALARAAAHAFIDAARAIAEHGDFRYAAGVVSLAQLNELLARGAAREA